MLFSSHKLIYRFGKILFFSRKNTAFTPYLSPDAVGHHKEKLGDPSLPGRKKTANLWFDG
jgi:hypothetical protein